jgi:tellurite resistance protein
MELSVPPAEVARAGLRAMKVVASADGEFHPLERGLMMSAQEHILQTTFDLDALPPITPDELAAAVPAEFRDRVLHACTIVALIDGEATAEEADQIDSYAAALGVDSQPLKDLRRIIDGQFLRARVDILRRSFIGQRMKDYVIRRGVRGLVTIARALLDQPHEATAARYRSLEAKPEGTLGRGYHEFVRRNGFAFPGEPGGAAEPIVFHDCLHVLAGYDTTSIEETQIASFQAGILNKDPIFGLLFMLAQFHLGVQVTPVTPAEKMVVDPALMLAAFARGTHVNRDLCTAWQPWDDFDRQVSELREAYNILPRS